MNSINAIKNLALIGGRGAGKSKVSRKLNKISGRTVFSTDSLICYESGGVTIAELVSQKNGWISFREKEFEILQKLCQMNEIIIDCGGGIIVDISESENRQQEEIFSERKAKLLQSYTEVIYLYREPEWLITKFTDDHNRPDLPGNYEEILARRLPWYKKIAHLIVPMADKSPGDAAIIIADKYRLDG